jgi:hypothetical protein
MGLEDNVAVTSSVNGSPFEDDDRRDDVLEHWERWMKNYRVWEATRKVFLYPENFLEPDLRKNKTQLFENFESLAGDGLEAANAITQYLQDFTNLATLRIVGSTYKNTESEAGQANKLALVGIREDGSEIYVRERTQSGVAPVWLPWVKLDTTIPAKFISPVYAFGTLHLFWAKEDKKMEEMYAINDERNLDFNPKKDIKSEEEFVPFIKDSSLLIVEKNDFPPDLQKEGLHFDLPFVRKINWDLRQILKGLDLLVPKALSSPSLSSLLYLVNNKNGRNIRSYREKQFDIEDVFNFSDSLAAYRNKDYRMVSKKEIDSFLKEGVAAFSAQLNNDLLEAQLDESILEQAAYLVLEGNQVEQSSRDKFIKFVSRPYGLKEKALKKMKSDVKFWEMNQVVLTNFFKGVLVDSTNPRGKRMNEIPTIFGQTIKVNAQYIARSGDEWSLPKDIALNEKTFFFSESDLPDGQKCSAEHLRPEHQIIRLISGFKDPEKTGNDTLEYREALSVLDASSFSNGIEITSDSEIDNPSSLRWQTNIYIKQVNQTIDTIEGGANLYVPQNIKVYELNIRSGNSKAETTISLELKQQETDLESPWMKENSAKSANEVLNFIEQQYTGDTKPIFDDAIDYFNVLNDDDVKNNPPLDIILKLVRKEKEPDEDYLKRVKQLVKTRIQEEEETNADYENYLEKKNQQFQERKNASNSLGRLT